jgi:hypothetical protein
MAAVAINAITVLRNMNVLLIQYLPDIMMLS